jgi:hypothetical protein
MLTAILITLLVVAALGYALAGRSDAAILRRPYANRYNDAAGAREDHLD